MAARRNKSQARRNPGTGMPGWVWLLAGLVLGAALFFLLPGMLKQEGDGFFRPQPNPDARPAGVAPADAEADAAAATAAGSAAAAAGTPRETQYDFYTLLPGQEVQMTDAELAASARAEAERAAAAAAAEVPAQPVALDEGDAAARAATPAAEPASPAPAAATAAAGDARYILQAGAFGASGDAEATKARIALLGLSARVEAAEIQGKTVYRVRMGPYGTASELAEAKQKLASGGLPAMAIRAQ